MIRVGGDYGTTMALRYAWFDSYDSVGYVLTLHISPPTICPYLKRGAMSSWEQELQELGHKAGQSRSLTEHIIEDHAEFWCLCLAIPRVYIHL
eukprot:COSAG05_NODE_291_length_12036_cov_15.352266_1_plen_93_part_00